MRTLWLFILVCVACCRHRMITPVIVTIGAALAGCFDPNIISLRVIDMVVGDHPHDDAGTTHYQSPTCNMGQPPTCDEGAHEVVCIGGEWFKNRSCDECSVDATDHHVTCRGAHAVENDPCFVVGEIACNDAADAILKCSPYLVWKEWAKCGHCSIAGLNTTCTQCALGPPTVLGSSCSDDSSCGTHRCNTSARKCAYPCASDCDCQVGYHCSANGICQ